MTGTINDAGEETVASSCVDHNGVNAAVESSNDNEIRSVADHPLTVPTPGGSSSESNSNPKKRSVVETTATVTTTTTSSSSGNVMIPITSEGDMPKKRFYRQRAHCNPLSHNDNFDYPRQGPDFMDWTAELYPPLPLPPPSSQTTTDDDVLSTAVAPTVLDIGCGFGGLTVALATILPDETILGMEIRAKVTEYVRLRLLALRKEHASEASSISRRSPYQNASVLRTNSMKFLPNYFHKASIRKMFFCFPDPHFKRKNHPRRIVSERLLSEYAYFLMPNVGMLYTITDVKELHGWHVLKCDNHPLFERVTDEDNAKDPCVHAMITETEEGKKVERNGGNKYYAVYRRISNPPLASTTTTFGDGGTLEWHLGNFFQEEHKASVVADDDDDDDDDEGRQEPLGD